MNEYREFTAKTVNDAITLACETFSVISERLDYEVVSEGSNGFLGMGVKPAKIRARIKEFKFEESVSNEVKPKEDNTEFDKEPAKFESSLNTDYSLIESSAKTFLKDVFHAMDMPVDIEVSFDVEEKILSINLSGEDMGVLIGKRGQTLDSLQYLVSLVVNKNQPEYIHVKVDTENYRARRKVTLENLAKKTAFTVRKTRKSFSLEPMNPYERRIIHSTLQSDRYVTTHSEGDEPYRRVVITLKRN
ncbi:RNA-binding cell elongation regulator Jag/EloR [Butyrivibrio sp. NC3005]|uniref:RNA-binding cell elongation regulator Jag/EloR n=1 Tax=Butyrivibrio sp. NC3005 TaxID=1280685 RepID=UPI0004136638|nr:RNA-binding cell elongation regulator Jag/EloR [Butyrivibrio sp. NC3005]